MLISAVVVQLHTSRAAECDNKQSLLQIFMLDDELAAGRAINRSDHRFEETVVVAGSSGRGAAEHRQHGVKPRHRHMP